jgi:multicomponent Na+:H+ antiporter subunit A
LNAPLALSVLSVVTGVGLYVGWTSLRRSTSWVEIVFGWGPARWYTASLEGVSQLARVVTGVIQNGYLRIYLLTIMVTTVAVVGFTLISRNALPILLAWSEVRLYEAALATLIMVAALGAVFARGRLSAVASLGVVGYGVALVYLLYGAPDVAMTQVLIETLTVILFVFVFYHLAPFSRLSGRTTRLRDATVSILMGGLMTLLVLAATATPPASVLAPFFSENSKPIAHGSNVVNVILVDFRGLDTLGEITVLAAAAIGVFALLRLRPRSGRPE